MLNSPQEKELYKTLLERNAISTGALMKAFGLKRTYKKIVGKTFERNAPNPNDTCINTIKVIERTVKYCDTKFSPPKTIYHPKLYFVQGNKMILRHLHYNFIRKHYHEV